MAFIPLICDELGDLLFTGANYEELFQDIKNRSAGGSCRRRRHPWAFQNRTESNIDIKTDKDIFQLSLDVQQFSPEELTVKSLDKNFIVVEGKQEEREDEHGYISRHFIRKYKLPEEFNSMSIQSNLSSDGLLTVTAIKKEVKSDEKEIPIKLTGPAKSNNVAINEENKENNQEKTEESKE